MSVTVRMLCPCGSEEVVSLDSFLKTPGGKFAYTTGIQCLKCFCIPTIDYNVELQRKVENAKTNS
jgi:hypothetical protein